jgi:hypothetical protein
MDITLELSSLDGLIASFERESLRLTAALRFSELIRNRFFILLLNLSHNYQNQPQTNTVFVQQRKEMDRVEGFEPTTSATVC